VKALTGRHNTLTAELLAHLAEVEARGIYRERACSSLYTYCVYELRLSEDEAQRRTKAARTAREYPVLFEMLAAGAIHLTGLLLLAPYLTRENHAELLARARFRTKREIEHLVAEIAPRPDVPARIEPLGPRSAPRNSWQAYMMALGGTVRALVPGVGRGEAPPVSPDEETQDEETEVDFVDASEPGPPTPARVDATPALASQALAPLCYSVQFTASQRYVELLEEARNLLQHQVPDRDVARVHELAMEAFVEELRKRRRAERPKRPAPARVNNTSEGPAPERIAGTPDASAPARVQAPGRYVPAEIRRAVWERDEGRCTFEDSGGRRCQERAGLEIHHEHAFALGGETTLENLRLLCRSHNALLAEQDFGRAQVERMKNGRL
jgi:hypothetical protein